MDKVASLVEVITDYVTSIDTKIIFLAMIVIAIMAVITIIRNTVKLGIMLVTLALLTGSFGKVMLEVKENYGFKVENDTAIVKIKGKEVTINKDSINKLNVEDDKLDYRIKVETESELITIKVPIFMIKRVRAFIEGISE